MKKAMIEIRVTRNNAILYNCSHCKKCVSVGKFLLIYDVCPRCNLKFKNKAKIIRGDNELYDVD